MVDVAARSSVIPSPNLAVEGSVASLPGVREALFLPGTDDELEHIQRDLVEDDCIEEEVVGTDGEDSNSPPPTMMARRLRQEPRISFVFDDTTGDLVDPYPTIFLPRCSVVQEQNPRCSARPHGSPVNPSAAYLKAAQGSKADLKKKRKDTKGKDKATGLATSLKRTRDDDDGAQNIEKLVTKKLKSKDTAVADDKVVRATPAIRRRGPGPSKPPAVTLGVGGGGFGEKVPSTAKAIKNGLKSIGVLEVEENFGAFVKVDGRYWNKEVAPFVGERYTAPCDHCKRLGTQCRKFLTNTVICVRCHYSKLPCKVNGVPALNPIDHYRPKSYQTLNAFEGALDTLAQHADSIEDSIVNYMAGINVLSQLNGLRVQAGHLRECAVYNGEADAVDGDNDGKDGDSDAAGLSKAGPSKSG
ncbi:hypothetical protein ARMGADRAFT_1076054 [Armillaria gallica]|uniref:Zn(2)-C6 fungal-type domain-containing protein n=1 Tax=Armillaria gallica TaxID=47427 RepID=A0A2H3E894_ARMGA|nr:hypothetical protein ARMGADRAFT_1076054 [Armillaria gallica]